MKDDDELLSCIANALCIPKTFIHLSDDGEIIAFVDDEWIHHLTKYSCIKEYKTPENQQLPLFLDSYQNGNSFNGLTKLCIFSCQGNHHLENAICLNEYSTCFGQKIASLGKHCYFCNWKDSCTSYPDSYYEENFESDADPRNHKSSALLSSKTKVNGDHKESLISDDNPSTVNCVNTTLHFNILPSLAELHINGSVFCIKKVNVHSVYDTVMYSPYRLINSNAKPLFFVFQLLKVLDFIHLNFPQTRLNYLSWNHIELNELLWIQADVKLPAKFNAHASSKKIEDKSQLPSNTTVDSTLLKNMVDFWVCGKVSNFDYLMFLNKLAGRRLNDPNNHPILPWVSDLSGPDGNWRDFTKSKYRLNKGDDQLQLQYAMAATATHSGGNVHVPYHVPDMLSDITFYVYKSRLISKSVLQKHVRSYWEPNEYPSTVQRMQEWTPDECIPEFFNDPSIFKSHHTDMVDLGVPNWCDSPEDFVQKHMSMLESDFVSERLHHWVDITFGYKLSGKFAYQSLNVCRQLVDQHTHPTSHGIVQLFYSPHPQKRRTTLHSPEKVLLSIAAHASKSANQDKKSDLDTAETVKTLPNENTDSFKEDEPPPTEDTNVKNYRKIRLPDNFDPFSNLDLLEKLLNFKTTETDTLKFSSELEEALQNNMKKMTRCSEEELIADHNTLVLMCLIVELFMLPHANCVVSKFSLSERLERASLYFQSNKHQLPQTVKNALTYLFKSFAKPPMQICADLRKFESMTEGSNPASSTKLFKWTNHKGYPSPRPWHLLTESMQIFHFPVYFENLYGFISFLLEATDNYAVSLGKQHFDKVKENLLALLKRLRSSKEGMDLLLPYIVRFLKQPLPHSADFLVLIFDVVAEELGPENTQKQLLPVILSIYSQLNGNARTQAIDCDVVKLCIDTLYDKYFLVQLLNRLGVSLFLESFSRLFADCMLLNHSCSGLLISAQWLLKLLGPTLSSKFIIRNLLLVLNSCYCKKIVDDEPCSKNDELILECLVYAASLYGPSLLTLQYIPHTSYSVSSSISGTGFTEQSYATLVASITLLITVIPYLNDHTLMEELNRMSKEIIMPLIGVISSKRIRFPEGAVQRRYLCTQTITLLHAIAFRIGREMSRAHLTGLLQSFFSNFLIHNANDDDALRNPDESDELDIKTDGIMLIPSSLEPEADSIAAAVRMGEMGTIPEASMTYSESPPKRISRHVSVLDAKLAEEINLELKLTFCAETAYLSYVPFARLMGSMHMEEVLKDNDIVWRLSQRVTELSKEIKSLDLKEQSASATTSMVGNQIVVEDKQETSDASTNSLSLKKDQGDEECHLKGNWLAYWGHEIGLPFDDNHIHFNQIDLCTFQGHTSAVRSIYVNNTEEWFLSGSKDKTVKVWSLSNGSNDVVSPLFTYRNHKKSVFYAGMVEANMNVVSCDGSLNIWDPYTGKQLKAFETSDFKSAISTMSILPAPHQQVLVATSDSMLRMVDMRTNSLVQEYKSTVGASVGIVRSLCTNNYWAAACFGSGVISLLDLRMGPVLRMWQAHDNDVLSSIPVSQSHFLTSSLDQTIAYWDIGFHQPIMVYRGLPEPAHVVRTFHNEILSTTASNRFMVHSLPPPNSSTDNSSVKLSLEKATHSTRLRSDMLRGSLTAFAVLKMKRQLVVSSDSGAIKLLA